MSVGATCSTWNRTLRSAELSPTMSSNPRRERSAGGDSRSPAEGAREASPPLRGPRVAGSRARCASRSVRIWCACGPSCRAGLGPVPLPSLWNRSLIEASPPPATIGKSATDFTANARYVSASMVASGGRSLALGTITGTRFSLTCSSIHGMSSTRERPTGKGVRPGAATAWVERKTPAASTITKMSAPPRGTGRAGTGRR